MAPKPPSLPAQTAEVPTNQAQVPIAGSVFVNNTSYSGCDIKVVVTIYGGGDSYKERVKLLEAQIDVQEARVTTLKREKSKLDSRISSAKTGTFSKATLLLRRGAVDTEINDLENSLIPGLKREIEVLRFNGPTVTTKTLAEIQTLSVSTHRDKFAVRACGTVYPKGFTRGPREISGSMIFTVFNQNVLYDFLEAHASDFDATAFTSALLDQLPPVDILVSFANEYGSVSRMEIKGVEFVDDGQVMSIEDILTENVVSFVARDYDPMRSIGKRKLDTTSMEIHRVQPISASDLILEEDYQSIKNSLDPFSRFRRRRNPFL
jgi:hypothetical protein